MAETPIESFCEDLLRHKSTQNLNQNSNQNGEIRNGEIKNNRNYGNNGNYGNFDNREIENGIGGVRTDGNEYVPSQNSVTTPSWIRTVFLTAINQAHTTALFLVLLFSILAIVRLVLLESSRVL